MCVWGYLFDFNFQVIDKMIQGKGAFKHKLNEASKKVLDERIKKALDNSGFIEDIDKLQHTKANLESQLKKGNLSEEERKEIEHELQKVKDKIDARNRSRKALEDATRQSQVREAQNESGGEATEKIMQEASESSFSCSIF